MVCAGIGQNEQPRFLELVLCLVGEGSWGMTARNGTRSRVLGKLEHCTLSIRPCRLHDDVVRVLDGDDHSCSHHEFIPCSAEVDDEDACVRVPPTFQMASGGVHRHAFRRRSKRTFADRSASIVLA